MAGWARQEKKQQQQRRNDDGNRKDIKTFWRTSKQTSIRGNLPTEHPPPGTHTAHTVHVHVDESLWEKVNQRRMNGSGKEVSRPSLPYSSCSYELLKKLITGPLHLQFFWITWLPLLFPRWVDQFYKFISPLELIEIIDGRRTMDLRHR